MALPTCGQLEICTQYAFLEQKDAKGQWQRTVNKLFGRVVSGGILTPSSGSIPKTGGSRVDLHSDIPEGSGSSF